MQLRFSPGIMQLFQHRDWPGNIRELENSVARYVILEDEETLRHQLLGKRTFLSVPIDIAEDGPIPLKVIAKQAVREMERDLIPRLLQVNHWNRYKTAQILKISYRALIYKIHQASLPPKSARKKRQSRPATLLLPCAPLPRPTD